MKDTSQDVRTGRATVRSPDTKEPRANNKAVVRKKKRHAKPLPPTEIYALSIEQFCRAHYFSVAAFYVLKKRGLTPPEMVLGGKHLISIEAAAEWRKRRTEATKQESEAASA